MIDLFVDNDELLGVYELSGGQLKMCFDWNGHNSMNNPNVRPQSVWAGLHSDREMLVLERIGPIRSHPDEEAILGAWEIEAASLQLVNMVGFQSRLWAVPTGVVQPGRRVIVTPDSLIIKGQPSETTSSEDATSFGSSPSWTQPMARDDVFMYALDVTRHWISFSALFGQTCPGIYRLEKGQLVIRLGGESRPTDIAAPPKEGEALLTLRRPKAAETELPADRSNAASLTTSASRPAGVNGEKSRGDASLDDARIAEDIAATMLRRFDANGDGSLSADEWATWVRMNTGSKFFDLHHERKLTHAQLVQRSEDEHRSSQSVDQEVRR